MLKKIILATLTITAFLTTKLSQTTGVAYYTETRQVEEAIEKANHSLDSMMGSENPTDMPAGADKMIKDMLNQLFEDMKETKTELWFSSTETLYQESEKDLTADDLNQNDVQVISNMLNAQDVTYLDLESQEQINQKQFMMKQFLVTDPISKTNWKVTGKKKVIHGLDCYHATASDTVESVEVWFTPSIPVSSGPKGYHGLPGLILEAKITPIKKSSATKEDALSNFTNGNVFVTVIKLSSLEFLDSSKKLKKPSKGKKVKSTLAYNKMIGEKMEEFSKGKKGASISIDN